MKFSEKWLREWVDPPVSREVLVERLTMAGLEVDSVEPVAGEFSGVVVAEVLTVEPHPDAQKLRVCQVSDGGGEPLQIVCGAANVRAGLKVPLARVGAKLPGGMKIRKAKLRGVPSAGMLCAAAELGLAESSDGLLELPADAPVGADLQDYLELDDVSIEIDLTPNRGDCLGLVGIAREVAMLTGCEAPGVSVEPVPAVSGEALPVALENPEHCPRYCGRVIQGVDAAAEPPLWLKERLRRSGLRSINPVVDVTNFVMLELGQPMHAFDLSRIEQGIRVRLAREGETLELLDGQELELRPDTLVIADHTHALALAGIMGGAESGVEQDTRDIFLESAFFTPEQIAGKARSYRLHTDSSHRFERGVDYTGQARAIERATALILEICGGSPGPLVEAQEPECLPQRAPITLRSRRLQRVLGCSPETGQVVEGLKRLGLEVKETDEGWSIQPPPFRFDLGLEEDLIEEAARVIGYDAIPDSVAEGALWLRPVPEASIGVGQLRQVLVDRGYQEAITYSFVDESLQRRIEPHLEPIPLANPISSDMNVMRTSLWPGLLTALRHNLDRQQERVRLFESGLVFLPPLDDPRQSPVLGGAIHGPAQAEQWAVDRRQIDFFDLKGDVEALLAQVDPDLSLFRFEAQEHPALHPGQSAVILREGEAIGQLGMLHPALARELDLPQAIGLFQITLEGLATRPLPVFRPLSRYPAVRRDLALVVDMAIPAAKVLDEVRRAAPETLEDLQLFDLYQGEGVDPGKKSLALALIFRGLSSTLIEPDVEQYVRRILEHLEQALGARLRS